MDYGHSGAAFKKFLWKYCYSHNKMSQAECFWGAKFHQNEEKNKGGIFCHKILTFWESITKILKKNN
jgi:hypothetical protein